MKRLLLSGLLVAGCAQAAYTPQQMAASLEMMSTIQYLNKLPLTYYSCSQKAPNGFITPDVLYYVQGYDKKNEVGAIYMGAVNGIQLGMGDLFIYKTLEGLKQGQYDYTKTSTIQIAGVDDTDIAVTVKSATDEEHYQCSLDSDLTAQSAESYRMAHPSAATLKHNQELAAKAERAAEKAAARKRAEAAKAAADADDLLSDVSKPKPHAQEQNDYRGLITYIQSVVAPEIKNHVDKSKYAGKTCDFHLHLSADGTVKGVNQLTGNDNLCNDVMGAIYVIDKFSTPPSVEIGNELGDIHISFKP